MDSAGALAGSEERQAGWAMRRGELLSRRAEGALEDSAEGMLARLSLYDAEDLLVLGRGGAGLRAVGAVGQLVVAAGAGVLAVALPWWLVCLTLQRAAPGLGGVWWALAAGAVAAAAQALWRARRDRRARAARALQSGALFQCLSRLLPYAPRGSRARLLRAGDVLALEVGLSGRRCCVQVDAQVMGLCVSMHREEAPLETVWVRELRASAADAALARAVVLADALAALLRRREPRAPRALPEHELRPASLSAPARAIDGARRASLLTRAPLVVREARPARLRRLGQARLGSFWGLSGAVLGGYGALFVPALLGGAAAPPEAASLSLVGAALALLLWARSPRAPRRHARRALVQLPQEARALEFDGRWLKLSGDGAVDLSGPFAASLTRFEDPLLGWLLGVDLRQGGRRALRFCVPIEDCALARQLPRLELDAPLLRPQDFSAWVWPLLRGLLPHGPSQLGPLP
jgi:hypothetical protein